MTPKRAPRAPSPHVFIHVASPTIPTAWKQWLPDAAQSDNDPHLHVAGAVDRRRRPRRGGLEVRTTKGAGNADALRTLHWT